MRELKLGAIALAWFSLASSAGSITLGQVDTFQDGSTNNWGGGASPSNQNGGPFGPGDLYLRITSTGGAGPGSRLATTNTLQWSGNYLTAGVKAVEFNFRNEDVDDTLLMRVVLIGPLGSRFTSITPITVPPGSGWIRATLNIRENDLIRVLGAESYTDVMSNVTNVLLRHDAEPPTSGGTPIVAVAGFDNITASAGPTIQPTSFTASAGILSSGNLASLFFQDTRRMHIQVFPPLSPTSPSAELTAEGTSLFPVLTSLKLRTVVSTSGVPASEVIQRIWLFNYLTNLYELVDVRGGTTADNVITVTPAGDPNRFVQAGTRRVRAKVGLYDPTTLLTVSWNLRVDEFVWLTQG